MVNCYCTYKDGLVVIKDSDFNAIMKVFKPIENGPSGVWLELFYDKEFYYKHGLRFYGIK